MLFSHGRDHMVVGFIQLPRKLICDDQQHHLSLNEQPPLTSPIGLAVVPVKMSVSTFMTIAILYVFVDIQLYQYCVGGGCSFSDKWCC
jgi:hypothetical protein